ncbi:MAG TPA: enoyl-CoA hydratase [Acetobacteraceae bacterium]|nr:enoyl-CoA hydratase [Acetobacteraceae bacterium]
MDSERVISLATERVVARVEGPIGWIVFNNPARRNAMSLDMWQGLGDAVEALTADDAVRVIVLRGAGGKAFVSGADISQFEAQRSTPETVAAYDEVADRAGTALDSTHKPTLAMIEGFCIGGGVGIAIRCDMRVASEASKFGIPAARLGLGYGPAGVRRLMDLVGPSYTKEIFFTARHFTAAEAHGMGLVNRVFAADALEDSVRAMCSGIAENAPLTMRALKRTVDAWAAGGEAGALAECDRLVAACFASADYIEGRRAFMEKRRPAFQGR